MAAACLISDADYVPYLYFMQSQRTKSISYVCGVDLGSNMFPTDGQSEAVRSL